KEEFYLQLIKFGEDYDEIKKRLTGESIDPFRPDGKKVIKKEKKDGDNKDGTEEGDKKTERGGNNEGGAAAPPIPPMPPGGGTPMLPDGTGNPGKDGDVPANTLLFRFLDVDVQPGERYQYRIKIKIDKPNYNRKDLADPKNAVPKELWSAAWVESPESAPIRPELYYYAVDEAVDLEHVAQNHKIGSPKLASATLA